jgi:hypothetical protein
MVRRSSKSRTLEVTGTRARFYPAVALQPLAHGRPVFGGMFWLSEKRFSGS